MSMYMPSGSRRTWESILPSMPWKLSVAVVAIDSSAWYASRPPVASMWRLMIEATVISPCPASAAAPGWVAGLVVAWWSARATAGSTAAAARMTAVRRDLFIR